MNLHQVIPCMGRRSRAVPAAQPQTPSLANQFAAIGSGMPGSTPLPAKTAPVIQHILERLNLPGILERQCGDDGDVPVGKVFSAYVHCRWDSDKPVPVQHFQEWASHSMVPHLVGAPASGLSEYRLGRVLGRAGASSEGIWKELMLNTHRVFDVDLKWLIYDLTSFYFEGSHGDSDLAAYGHSRDDKPGTKQVNIGLNVTGIHGIPFVYEVLPGNTDDRATVADNLRKLRQYYEMLGLDPNDVIVVGDKAMLTHELIHFYHEQGARYIGTTRGSKVEEDLLRSVADEELLRNPLPYLAQRFIQQPAAKAAEETYYAVRRTVSILPPAVSKGSDEESTSTTPQPSHAAEKKAPLVVPVLVVLALGKQRLDREKRETLLKKKEERLQEIQRHLNKGSYTHLDFAQKQLQQALQQYPSTHGMISGMVAPVQAFMRQILGRYPSSHCTLEKSAARVQADAGGAPAGPGIEPWDGALSPYPNSKASVTTGCQSPTGDAGPMGKQGKKTKKKENPPPLVLAWWRNQEAIDRDALLDGKYAVHFNCAEFADKEVFSRFKSRDGVERRINDVKNTVTVRPFHLQDDDRIRGLILACMVALLAATLAELELSRNGLPLTLGGLRHLFKDYSGSLLTFADGSQAVTPPNPNKWQSQVFTALSVNSELFTSVLVTGPHTHFSDALAPQPQPWKARQQPDTRFDDGT